MKRSVAVVLASAACRHADHVRDGLQYSEQPRRPALAGRVVLEELRVAPRRLPGDPVVLELAALQRLGVIRVRTCATSSDAVLSDDSAACVLVSSGGESVRAWVNSRSSNRTTIVHANGRATTAMLSFSRTGEESSVHWLDGEGRADETTRLPSPTGLILSRASALFGDGGWFTAPVGRGIHAPLDLRMSARGPIERSGDARADVTGPCVALRRGTLCANRTVADHALLRYFPVRAASSSSLPRIPDELRGLLRESEIRVLMGLGEARSGVDLVFGFPFAANAAGRAFVARFDENSVDIVDAHEIDFSLVPAERRHFCGGHAEHWPVAHDEHRLAVACGNQALISTTLRRGRVDRNSTEVVLRQPITNGRYRLIPPVGHDESTSRRTHLLYAHWCGTPPSEGNGGYLCVSCVRAAQRAQELFRRSVRSWSAWDISIGLSDVGEDRLMFASADLDSNTIVVQQIRVHGNRAETEWETRVSGRGVAFLQQFEAM